MENAVFLKLTKMDSRFAGGARGRYNYSHITVCL